MTTDNLKSGKYLVFRVKDDMFAIPLSEVREVIAMSNMTRLPATNNKLEGVFNLRGKILSIADLRNKIGNGDYTSNRPCIVAVKVGDHEIGSIVDDVVEVVSYSSEQLHKNIDEVSHSVTFHDYISGVAKEKNGNLTVLLDMKKLLNFS